MRFNKWMFKLGLVAAQIVSVPAISSAQEVPSLAELKSEYVRPINIPAPEDNQLTQAKVKLGKVLFFDPRLSKTAAMSCASCHNPSLGWEDGMPTGQGHAGNRLGRHSPSILNLAWAPNLFWDGRAKSLEEQATGPIMASGEMGMNAGLLLERLKQIKGYKPLFSKAFFNGELSVENVGKAIASYERTIISGEAPFDKWIKGNETAISASS